MQFPTHNVFYLFINIDLKLSVLCKGMTKAYFVLKVPLSSNYLTNTLLLKVEGKGITLT